MLGAILPLSSTTLAAITDGTSNTIMFSEVASSKAYPDTDTSGASQIDFMAWWFRRAIRMIASHPPPGRPGCQGKVIGFPAVAFTEPDPKPNSRRGERPASPTARPGSS